MFDADFEVDKFEIFVDDDNDKELEVGGADAIGVEGTSAVALVIFSLIVVGLAIF